MAELTIEQKNDYLADDNQCPICQSDNIEGNGFGSDNKQAWHEILCLDCGARWNDIFQLVDVELLEDRSK